MKRLLRLALAVAGHTEHAQANLLWCAQRAGELDLKGAQGVTLYGSQSRDDDGGCYLVGWANEGVGRQQPLILRVTAAGVPGAN